MSKYNEWNATFYKANVVEESVTYKKGSTQYTVGATSTSSTAYPKNGQSGSYWYVYEGVQ